MFDGENDLWWININRYFSIRDVKQKNNVSLLSRHIHAFSLLLSLPCWWCLEYADYPLLRGKTHLQKVYPSIALNYFWQGLVLEIYIVWSSPSLPLLLRSLWLGVEVPVRFIFMCKLDMFKIIRIRSSHVQKPRPLTTTQKCKYERTMGAIS